LFRHFDSILAISWRA